jgi:hypothetical protein
MCIRRYPSLRITPEAPHHQTDHQHSSADHYEVVVHLLASLLVPTHNQCRGLNNRIVTVTLGGDCSKWCLSSHALLVTSHLVSYCFLFRLRRLLVLGSDAHIALGHLVATLVSGVVLSARGGSSAAAGVGDIRSGGFVWLNVWAC